MEIKPVGNHLEAVCSGCGEVLLIGSGDSVNFRPGDQIDLGGIKLPFPKGLLCSACDRRENEGESLSIKMMPLACSKCDSKLSPDNFEPEFDEDGNLKGLVCSDCSEPWRNENAEWNQ